MDQYESLINKIKETDLKKLNYKELASLSEEIRRYIIAMCGKNGGHLASNLGVVELTVALHKAFDFPKDKLLFDVGHQCYTHKILTGRSLDQLRKENGTDGFQKRKESNYDCFEAGHSSTSISAAMGLALDRDLKKEDYHIISLIGDASIANGLAFEALNNIDDFKHKVIIIINDNNMSISQSVGALHKALQNIRLSPRYLKMKSDFRKKMGRNKITRSLFSFFKSVKDFIKNIFLRNNIFELFGLYYIGNVDGYDFKEMEKAFKKAKKKKSSVVIHVTTIKGKGYGLSETKNVSSWHSVKPFDTTTGKSLDKTIEGEISIQETYALGLEKILSKDPYSILINPGTQIGSKIDFLFKKYPQQCFDVGISEEHAVTFASGYSLNNAHSYISIYSTFLQRSYDQINHDIARMDLPVTLLIDRSGLVGGDGETHQGIFDESFLINMPNMAVAMAKDFSESIELIKFSHAYSHPLAIRYPVGIYQKDEGTSKEINLGDWFIEKEDKDQKVCIISFGPKLNKLLKKGLPITIVNALFQSPINEEVLKSLINYKHIIIYNPYAIKEGFAYHVLAKLKELNYKNDIRIISLENSFIQKGTIEQQEKRCHVHIDDVIEIVNSLI